MYVIYVVFTLARARDKLDNGVEERWEYMFFPEHFTYPSAQQRCALHSISVSKPCVIQIVFQLINLREYDVTNGKQNVA